MKNLTLKTIIIAVLCNVLFGSAIPFIKLGYQYFNINNLFSTILFSGIRFFVSGIILFFITFTVERKVPLITKGNVKTVFLLALTYIFLQYIFCYIGLSNTSGSLGSIITSTSAFISIFLAHFIYPDDKLNLKKIIGVTIGFIGVIVVCFSNDNFKSFSFFGEGFMLLAAIFFVIGSAINKKATKLNSAFTVVTYNLLIGGTMLILVGIIGYNGEIAISLEGLLILLYLIIVAVVGFTVWGTLLKNYPIGKLGIYTCLIPISGAIFSALVLGENILSWQYLTAIILVSAGIFIVNMHFKKQ